MQNMKALYKLKRYLLIKLIYIIILDLNTLHFYPYTISIYQHVFIVHGTYNCDVELRGMF